MVEQDWTWQSILDPTEKALAELAGALEYHSYYNDHSFPIGTLIKITFQNGGTAYWRKVALENGHPI